MRINPGDLGVDYSFARPGPSNMANQGVRFACRYLSPAPNQKNLTPDERDALHAAGIGIILNWEWYASRPGEGATAGKTDASVAVDQARALGYPAGSVIVYSVDFDVPVTLVPNVLQYLRTAELVTAAAGYRTGAYIKYSLIEQLVANNIATALLWQPYAWAPRGSGDQGRAQHPAAHVFQRLGLVNLDVSGIDENIALRPFDVWLPGDTQPPTSEVHVADFICSFDGNTYAVSPGGVMPLTGRMLPAYATTPNLGDISTDDEAKTKARIQFFLANGRWPTATYQDPGPREAKVTNLPPPSGAARPLTVTLTGTATPT